MSLLTICSLPIYTISIAFLPNRLDFVSNYLNNNINNKNLTPPAVSHMRWENQEWYDPDTDLSKNLTSKMKWNETFSTVPIAHTKNHQKISHLFNFLPFEPFSLSM